MTSLLERAVHTIDESTPKMWIFVDCVGLSSVCRFQPVLSRVLLS